MKRVADLIGFLFQPAEMPGRMRLSIFRSAFILCAALFFGAAAYSQTVPAMISFQGRLTDTLNNPLEGNHNLVFAVYNVPAGGTPLWTETQSPVPAVNGMLTAQLGGVTPIPPEVFSGADAYLEITVDGTVLSPREHLITVPYAFNARLLDGNGAAAFVSTANVNQIIGGVKTFTGSIDMNGTGRILNLAPPASLTDAATKGYVDGTVQNSSAFILASTQTYTGTNTYLNQITVSSDIYISAGSINLHGNIVTTPAGLLDAAKLENLVPNALLDASSVTKQGNTFNGPDQLLRLDGTGRLPALDGSLLLNISSVAAGAIWDLQIGGGISQSKITNLVSDLGIHLARLDQLAVDTTTISSDLANVIANLGNTDAGLGIRLDNVAADTATITNNLAGEITNRGTAVTNEANARTAADSLIATDTTTIATLLAGEITNRSAGDNALTARLDTVASDTATLNSAVVHLAGAETITGVKTFDANLSVMNGNLGVGVAAASAKIEVKASDTQNYSLAVGIGTAYNFVVSTSGALGVGAASPKAKMEVTGGTNPGEYIMILNTGNKAAAWLRNK